MKLDIDKDLGLHLPAAGNKPKCFIMLFSVLLTMGLLGFASYKNNYWVFSHEIKVEKVETENVEWQLLQKEFDELKKELIALSRENSIQQATNKALNRKLLKVEDELTAERKKQLLYTDILSADDVNKGLHIRHFDLRKRTRQDGERRYHYTVVLSQNKGDKKIIQGQYVIRITGKENGKEISYTHRELAADGIEAERKFSLKYYQSLEGDIMLPEAFEPKKVTLWIIPKNKKLKTQRKAYQWGPLMAKKD